MRPVSKERQIFPQRKSRLERSSIHVSHQNVSRHPNEGELDCPLRGTSLSSDFRNAPKGRSKVPPTDRGWSGSGENIPNRWNTDRYCPHPADSDVSESLQVGRCAISQCPSVGAFAARARSTRWCRQSRWCRAHRSESRLNAVGSTVNRLPQSRMGRTR
jgi:hypothetical protein